MNSNQSIEVTGCEDCPLVNKLTGSSEWFWYCGHPGEKGDTDLIVGVTDPETPNWCPLKKSSLTISIKKD